MDMELLQISRYGDIRVTVAATCCVRWLVGGYPPASGVPRDSTHWVTDILKTSDARLRTESCPKNCVTAKISVGGYFRLAVLALILICM